MTTTTLLYNKKGLILGALNEQSMAWQTALKAREAGASLVLSNAPLALRMGQIRELGQICEAPVIAADATSVPDLENLIDKTLEHFGGPFDFVLHAVGMSANIRKNIPYEAANYEYFMRTLDVSALSFHKLLRVLYARDALRAGGSVVALSYIAAQRAFPGYADMADAKALLESIARSFGHIYGRRKGVRVNTVSQSPTPTTASAGIAGAERMLDYAHRLSPLGNASAADCADYLVSLFSDLTRHVTMQNLYHDGGFSAMGADLTTDLTTDNRPS